MSAAQLMTDLTRLGIHVEAHGDRLRYSPRSAVTPDLADRMKAHKGELLEHENPGWDYVNFLYVGVKGVGAHPERVHLEMQPGDTVFFHPVLLHGSGQNRTEGFRRAISCHRLAKCPVSAIRTRSPGDRVLTSAASQAPVPEAG